jgi:hypothetical protein
MTTEREPWTTDVTVTDPSILEQLLDMDATGTVSGSSTNVNQVIHNGDTELDAPMKISSIDEAAYLWVWNVQTGSRSRVNSNMLQSQLSKKLEDGRRAFTTVDPQIPQPKGQVLCRLHADAPDRETWAAMGFPACRKGNLRNEMELDLHMKHRHKSEYGEMMGRSDRSEKEEDRMLNRSLLEALVGQAQAAQTIQNIETEAPKRSRRSYNAEPKTEPCTECAETFEAKTQQAAKMKLSAHMNKVHTPEE